MTVIPYADQLPFIPYTRVSRVGKRDLLASPDEQRATIKTLGAREALPLLDDDSFHDEDRSANDFNRANFVRAMELIRSGRAGGIVVATLDRFSRDVFAGATMLREISAIGGRLYADDAGGLVDLDDDESLIFYIMRGTMGTLEHRRKGRGLMTSIARSIRGGRHLADLYGYTRPKGFHTVTVDGETFKVRYPIKPNPAEAPAVQRAYEMRAEPNPATGNPHSWQAIADELNARWPLPDGLWTWSRVRAMVKSETYLGIAHSGKHRTAGAHEAIVSRELWERANRPMPGPSHDPDREPRMLSGILYCGSCGYRLRPDWNNGLRYYRCKRRHKVGVCPAPVQIPAKASEAFMVETLVEHFKTRTYHGAANGADVAEAERAYDRQVEIVRAMAPEYMSRHTLADDVREIIEATWTKANVELDRLRNERSRVKSDAVGVAEWPSDLDASGIADLPSGELRTLIAAAFPVVFARRGVGYREDVPSRLRPLWRSQAPAEIVEGRRMRPIRSYFVAG